MDERQQRGLAQMMVQQGRSARRVADVHSCDGKSTCTRQKWSIEYLRGVTGKVTGFQIKWCVGNSLLWEWAASSQLCSLHRKMCREKKKRRTSILATCLKYRWAIHREKTEVQWGAIRCRTAWQDIRQIVSERADLAVVTATVKGGKTRSLPSRS